MTPPSPYTNKVGLLAMIADMLAASPTAQPGVGDNENELLAKIAISLQLLSGKTPTQATDFTDITSEGVISFDSDVFTRIASGITELKVNGEASSGETGGTVSITAGSFQINAPALLCASGFAMFARLLCIPFTYGGVGDVEFSTDTTSQVNMDGIPANITNMSAAITGTPIASQRLMFRIKDDGTPRTITWGSLFASRGATLPTVTTASKYKYVFFVWNEITTTWDCIDVRSEA